MRRVRGGRVVEADLEPVRHYYKWQAWMVVAETVVPLRRAARLLASVVVEHIAIPKAGETVGKAGAPRAVHIGRVIWSETM